MTDPVGVTADPRPVLMMGDEPDKAETVCKAMHRAFYLGQTYWQQADSESYAQNRRATATLAKFEALVQEVRAALEAQP